MPAWELRDPGILLDATNTMDTMLSSMRIGHTRKVRQVWPDLLRFDNIIFAKLEL